MTCGYQRLCEDASSEIAGLDSWLANPSVPSVRDRLIMKPWLIYIALASAGTANAAAENCEALRSQIESKIAAAGVTRFTVATVDANAEAGGQVVGSCELGGKKIVYQREGAPPPAPDAASGGAPPRAADERILTECKDGTVSVGCDCKR